MSIISPAAEKRDTTEKLSLVEEVPAEIGDVRLSYIAPDLISEKDVEWIKIVTEEMYTKPSLKLIGQNLRAGSLMLWRAEGVAEGIFLLTIDFQDTGRELGIFGMAGKNFLANMDYFDKRLAEIGRAAQCRWITAYTLNLRTAKRFEKELGYKIMSQFQVKDLGNEHILEL